MGGYLIIWTWSIRGVENVIESRGSGPWDFVTTQENREQGRMVRQG